MMYFGPRKLLSSQVSLHEILVRKLVTCSCYLLCPPECQISSQDEHYLSPPPPPPPPPGQKSNNMSLLLILMLGILGTAFVCLCYLTILKRYRSNLSNSRRNFASSGEDFVDGDHPIWHIQTAGLLQSVIDSIPVFEYKKGDGLFEGSDCSVCLSEFVEDENLRLLPKCSHAFHITCIDTWLRSHKNCPLCRRPVAPDAEISAQMDTGQSVLDSREDATVDEQEMNDENGEGRTSVLRSSEGENISPFWIEQGKILERNEGIRVLSDLGDHRFRVGEELQSVRRSFSMDLSSASRIYGQVGKIEAVMEEGSSSLEEVEMEVKKKQNLDIISIRKLENKNSTMNRSSRKSFSFGRSLQSVPIRMKRSLSSSGKSSFQSSDTLNRHLSTR